MEWEEPEWDEAEHQRFHVHLAQLDLREVGRIVTPSTKAAEMAKGLGYEVEVHFHEGSTIYEIRPGDEGAP